MKSVRLRYQKTVANFFIRGLALIVFATVAFFSSAAVMAFQEGASHKALDDLIVFVRVYERASQDIVGVLVNQDARQITVHDLATGKDVSIPKTDTLTIRQPLSINDAARYAGLPAVVGWKLNKLAERENPVGKIALINGQSVYITLGEASGLKSGQGLMVYRNKGDIKHPDTGAVIGALRPKVGQLKVIEIKPDLTQTRIVAIPGVETVLEVGDEVEPESRGTIVAVSPLFNEDGTLTTVGAGMGEDLTTALVQRKISVIERSVIGQALKELVVQNTALFDQKSSQKFGKLTGANYVLAGKIVPNGDRGTAYLRLIHVETGEILFAVSTAIDLSKAEAVPSTGPAVVVTGSPRLVQKKILKLTGKRAWEDSGVKIEKGQLITISAPDSRVDRAKRANYYGTGALVGALIAKIGDSVLEIDQSREFVAPADGTIYLRNNLHRSPNHTVDITITVYEQSP
jgi:TolB-like protein